MNFRTLFAIVAVLLLTGSTAIAQTCTAQCLYVDRSTGQCLQWQQICPRPDAGSRPERCTAQCLYVDRSTGQCRQWQQVCR
jgi:hypothetical protein